VERSDTHRVTEHAKPSDGFRKRSTHPTRYGLEYADFEYFFGQMKIVAGVRDLS
jgi:hypothetical protein